MCLFLSNIKQQKTRRINDKFFVNFCAAAHKGYALFNVGAHDFLSCQPIGVASESLPKTAHHRLQKNSAEHNF